MRPVHVPIAVALLACSPAVADNAKSSSTSESRNTGSFTGVSITTVIEVELTVGSSTSVELRGPSAWLPKVLTTVKDGVLVISMPGSFKKIPKLKAVIATPSLAKLSVSGVAEVKATGLDGDALAVEVAGVGELTLAGKVEAMQMDLPGTAEIAAKGLVTKTTALAIPGTANIELHATKQLDVDIDGVGTVVVHGKPKVVKRINGMGTVELE
jgi:hypothetical protein